MDPATDRPAGAKTSGSTRPPGSRLPVSVNLLPPDAPPAGRESDAEVRRRVLGDKPDYIASRPGADRERWEALRQRRHTGNVASGMVVRVVRVAGWTSITLGLLILGFVAHQLWVTTWFAERNQGELTVEREAHFEAAEITEVPFTPPGRTEILIDPDIVEAVEPPTLLVESAPEEGESFALIRIPKIEKLASGWNVVAGVSVSDLKNGAGHMPSTPLPGQPGNAVISGHRTTYGQPFHDLDVLEAGDVIYVDTALGTHGYTVRDVLVVQPTDLWVTDPRDGAWLTLTTCHPRFSARQRLVVQAELSSGPNAAVILAGQ